MFEKLSEINKNRKLALALGIFNFIFMFIIILISLGVIINQQNQITYLQDKLDQQNSTIILQGEKDEFIYEIE